MATTTTTGRDIDTEQVNAAAEELRGRISGDYTPIGAVSDFLLDARAAVGGDRDLVAEIDRLHIELAPSAQRTVVLSTTAVDMITKITSTANPATAAN